MKLNILILLFTCILFKSTFSQQIQWIKYYSNLPPNRCYSFTEMPDSGYVLVGNSYDTIQSKLYSFAMRIDKYGDTIWTKRYIQNSQSIIASIDKINDSLLICFGGFCLPGESYTNIGVININGDTVLHRSYGVPANSDYPLNIKHCLDGGFIMCTDGSSSDDIIKLDSNYNIQWTRSSYMSQCTNIMQDVDSGFVAVGCSGWLVQKYGVLRFDKNGGDIWYNPVGNMPSSPYSYYAWDIEVMPDSNYLICSDGTDWQMMKVNRNTGDTMWTKEYPVSLFGFNSRTISRIDHADNNHFICSFYESYNGVMLINGNDGDTIWTSRLPSGIMYNIYDVHRTRDGGYGYCGNVGSNTAFVKLDSLGNTIYTIVIENKTGLPVSFYPNPVTSDLFINTSTFATEKNLTITLTNLQGKIILKQQFDNAKAVDVSSLPNGIYVAEVRGRDKVVRGKVVVQH